MKFLIHMGDPYPNEGPNAKRMRTFYEALIEDGNEAKVLAPKNPDLEYQDVIGFDTVLLQTKSSLNRLLNQLSIGVNSVKASKKVDNVDVIITTTPPALISVFAWYIAKRKHAKLVYDVRDIWPDVAWEMGSFSSKSFISRVFEWNRDFMLKHSDLIMAVSERKVEKLKKYRPSADVIYITNGLDEKFVDNVENPSIIKEFDLNDQYTCVYFGNIGLAQGLIQLMKLAKKAKENNLPVKFILFGEGVEKNKLMTFARDNQLDNVSFPGRISNEDIYTVLKNCGMSFISLVNDNLQDSVPTKLYEALGAGCPVLLAASGESAEILEKSKLGIAVKPNDEVGLWNAFISIYENRKYYASMKEHAREVIIDNYSRQKAAKKMVKEIKMRFGGRTK